MKKLLSLIALFTSTSALAESDYGLEAKIQYVKLTPFSESDGTQDATSFAVHGEYGSQYYFALDTEMSQFGDQNSALVALHGGRKFDFGYLGALAGMVGGDLDAKFYGVEAGADYKNFSLDLRYTDWDIDGLNASYRMDAIAKYAITPKLSVFYDYAHYKLNDSDINFDDYYAGFSYQLTPDLTASLSMGEYHPIQTNEEESSVWDNYSFSLNYKIGKNTKINPINTPNFAQFLK